MIFFSLLFALLLEHLRPIGGQNRLILAFLSYADSLERYFNTGIRRHDIAAWFAAVAPVIVFTLWIYYLLYSFHPLLGWVWNVVMLYLTISPRQLTYSFSEIEAALKSGDLPLARQLLWEFYGIPADDLSSPEIARIAIELGLINSHRYVFAIIICFALLPGPLGPVLYRLAELLNERWGSRPDAFGKFALKAFEVIDWLPARATALGFAIAGNFEDAVYCWRAQAASWMDRNQGIILASGAGALGVCLGEPLLEAGGSHYRPELGVGDEADVDFLQSATGLFWRTLVLWLVLLLLLEIAGWAG
jgi:adenosylcobinamide-phosphate synthase